MPDCDLKLTGARVIDGTGAPARPAEVAVARDRIVAVEPPGGLDRWTAAETRALGGLALAPGFIDTHSHDDRALLDTPDLAAKVSQGVTTVVTGNCGISLAPLEPAADPPPPFDVLGDRSRYRYPRFAAWRDALGARPAAVNAVALIGHGTLRLGAMRALDRPADRDERARMRETFAQALDEGATGLSSGLYYAPSRAAPTDEVIDLARVMAGGPGLYATHLRDEADGVEDAIDESVAIGEAAGVPVLISHHKVTKPENFGRSVATLARIARARARHPVALDAYPYPASSTILEPARYHPEIKILVTWSAPEPQAAGRWLDALATEWGCSPHDAIRRLMPAGAIFFAMDEADVRRILGHPHTMIGSDGLPHDAHPHPRLWGSFARVLGHYVREVGLFPLEEAVRRMTALPAEVLGLADRGVIAPDRAADLVVFDPATIADRASWQAPTRRAAGIDQVFVNGSLVWSAGAPTGARPGRLLRGRPGGGAPGP